MSYISSDGTNMVIVNGEPSASINLQTSNVSNVISTRVDVNETQTEIKNKLKPSLGMIGPTTLPTFTPDMIGYTTTLTGIRGEFDVSGSNIIACVQGDTGPGMTLSAGVWMVTAYSTLIPTSNTAGTVYFSTISVSKSRTDYVEGTGARSVDGTASIPASGLPSNARILGSFTTTMVVPSSTEYFQLVNSSYLISTAFKLKCLPTSCFMTATRIA